MSPQVSDLLKHRKGAYHFLAQVFLDPLSWEFFQECSSRAEAFRSFPQTEEESPLARGFALLERFFQQPGQQEQQRFEDLRWDYTRLFLGIPKKLAPPYESVYRGEEPLVMQKATMEVRAAYLEEGLMAVQSGVQPDDHIGAELEFMYYLCARCLKASQQGDWDETARLLAKQRLFLKEHLGLWVPRFCENMVKHAQTDFYRAMGLILMGTVQEEQKEVA